LTHLVATRDTLVAIRQHFHEHVAKFRLWLVGFLGRRCINNDEKGWKTGTTTKQMPTMQKTYLELHIVVLELCANQHGGLDVGTLGDPFSAAGVILKAASGLSNGVVVVCGIEITEQGNVGIELRAFCFGVFGFVVCDRKKTE
jgi:hypothetical protein